MTAGTFHRFQTEKERSGLKEAARLQNPTARAFEPAAEPEAGGKRGRDAEGEERKKPPKRDKYAGMPRKKRRLLQRKELLEADEGVSLPNQKAVASGVKSAARHAPLGSRAEYTGAAEKKKKKDKGKPEGKGGGGSGGGGGGAAEGGGMKAAKRTSQKPKKSSFKSQKKFKRR